MIPVAKKELSRRIHINKFGQNDKYKDLIATELEFVQDNRPMIKTLAEVTYHLKTHYAFRGLRQIIPTAHITDFKRLENLAKQFHAEHFRPTKKFNKTF